MGIALNDSGSGEYKTVVYNSQVNYERILDEVSKDLLLLMSEWACTIIR